MADDGSILVTGAAGQLGAVGRTVTGLLLKRGLPVRAMVRREDDPAAALRAAGAEVVVGDLLEPANVYRVVSGCRARRCFYPAPVSEWLQLVRCIHTRRGTGLRPRMRNRLEYRHGEVFVHLSRIHGEPRPAVS
jgi:NAD(P)-dependent dehydrogenase (short-subunit alcohol dehydrogenase family)